MFISSLIHIYIYVYLYVIRLICIHILVGGFNPSEKYARQLG